MSIERDFTNEKIDKLRMYGGTNGKKIGLLYQGENYMLKFPPLPSSNKEISFLIAVLTNI